MNYYRRTALVALCAVSLAGYGLLRRLMLATTTKHQLQLIACAFNANSANPRSARASNSPWKPMNAPTIIWSRRSAAGSAQTTRRQWMLGRTLNQSNGLAAVLLCCSSSATPYRKYLSLSVSAIWLRHCLLLDPLLFGHRPDR